MDKKPRYRIGTKVYSYQNTNTAYEINRVRLAEKGTPYKNAYRLSLPSGNSNWINENSLSKIKSRKKR